MPLQSTLERVASSVEGSLGAGLMGLDGILVAQVSKEKSFDLTTVGAEYATVVKEARKAFESMGGKALAEILVTTEQANVLLAAVGRDYFVTLALASTGNLGRGRLELKRALPELEKEV